MDLESVTSWARAFQESRTLLTAIERAAGLTGVRRVDIAGPADPMLATAGRE